MIDAWTMFVDDVEVDRYSRETVAKILPKQPTWIQEHWEIVTKCANESRLWILGTLCGVLNSHSMPLKRTNRIFIWLTMLSLVGWGGGCVSVLEDDKPIRLPSPSGRL